MKSFGKWMLALAACGLFTLGAAFAGCDSGPKNVDKDKKPEELEEPLIEDDSEDEDAESEDAEMSAPKN